MKFHRCIDKAPGKDRDRSKRLRLASCLLIESGSTDDQAQPAVPGSSRFRGRRANNRLEPRAKDERRTSLGAISSVFGLKDGGDDTDPDDVSSSGVFPGATRTVHLKEQTGRHLVDEVANVREDAVTQFHAHQTRTA